MSSTGNIASKWNMPNVFVWYIFYSEHATNRAVEEKWHINNLSTITDSISRWSRLSQPSLIPPYNCGLFGNPTAEHFQYLGHGRIRSQDRRIWSLDLYSTCCRSYHFLGVTSYTNYKSQQRLRCRGGRTPHPSQPGIPPLLVTCSLQLKHQYLLLALIRALNCLILVRHLLHLVAIRFMSRRRPPPWSRY
jgi:hypothetical protein